MRQKLITRGARELKYEIRSIVEKARQVEALGRRIHWENIGDPIQKNARIPTWMKEIVKSFLDEDDTYGYCHSKGVPATREYLAELNNKRRGVQITVDDILFFNGLGDAISKVYQFILPTSRVIGPSPSYSTHSSSEAAHANHDPITYNLDPQNNWYPDLEDLRNKVKYNPSIVGLLIINPDNPTGMVYPREYLEQMVEIAREFNLFIISDEIYMNITYNEAEFCSLAEVIGDLPGISLKGISKELPWPGSRCGWAEFYNRQADPEFDKLCSALEDAKMVEVCSTKLPQLVIPKVFSDPRYREFRQEENKRIQQRSLDLANHLKDIPSIDFNLTNGSFYNTIVFRKGALSDRDPIMTEEPEINTIFMSWLKDSGIEPDRRFVYSLLAAKGICVVPLSSFCSNLDGFRITLLENDDEEREWIYRNLAEFIREYTHVTE